MQRKQCFKCGESKPLTNFYRHPRMADGHLNKCKSCTKRDVRENRAKRRDHYRSYDKVRANLPDRVEARASYQDTEAYAESHRAAAALWASNHPLAKRAHSIVARAKRDGRLIVKPCTVCGTKKNVHAHHPDYHRPLDVVFLCAACHASHHAEERAVCSEEAA